MNKLILRGHTSFYTSSREALCVEGKSQIVLGSSFLSHLANFVSLGNFFTSQEPEYQHLPSGVV